MNDEEWRWGGQSGLVGAKGWVSRRQSMRNVTYVIHFSNSNHTCYFLDF